MKKEANVHPQYRQVLYIDSATGDQFLIGSTLKCREEAVFDPKFGGDGKTYPAFKAPVTCASHPYYTGKQSTGNARGRIGKFNNRYKRGS